MQTDLLSITTEELLKKFGAGNHKPGSGSAAAFHGMISSKLLTTVISLTNEEKHRPIYQGSLPELLAMSKQIEDRIFPELSRLFKEDSVVFDETIKLRQARDNERNPIKKNSLKRKALKKLKTANEIPFKIASLCIELSQIAEFVFDYGFKSARGDSQVALSGAVAAIAGCVSIMQLNLLSFGSDEYLWTEEIAKKCKTLKDKYANLNVIANSKIDVLEREVSEKVEFHKQIDNLLNNARSVANPSDTQIENIVIGLQRCIWKNRTKIWKNDTPENPTEVLSPERIFRKALGYDFAVHQISTLLTT